MQTMTLTLRLGMGVFAVATLAVAASPTIQLSGNYVEARTADVYTGPCFANSEAQLVGELAVFGWQVNKGSWKGVQLEGLSVVAAVKANSTLGGGQTYPVKAVLLVDERANLEQRDALRQFARRMAGDLLQDIVRVEPMKIDFTVDGDSIHDSKVTLTAGTLAQIKTRELHRGDHICSNEQVWYPPLAETDHAMPAYAEQHRFGGPGLNATWSSPDKRSAFVGTFRLAE
jgi:hypothetical protein